MARIRSIKPEFFDDPDIAADLTIPQRYLYIGLWGLCYDNWTMEYDPKRVKKAVFGYDKRPTVSEVDEMVAVIAASGRAVFFTHEGHTCIYLPKCVVHQVINRPSKSPIPAPSLNTHGALMDGTGNWEQGKERNGEGIRACAREDAPPSFDECYAAYPVHRFEDEACVAFDALVASGTDPATILAACKAAPRSTRQSLGKFLAEGTWRDHIPKRKRAKCATCNGDGVLYDAALDVATPCPDCKEVT